MPVLPPFAYSHFRLWPYMFPPGIPQRIARLDARSAPQATTFLSTSTFSAPAPTHQILNPTSAHSFARTKFDIF
jgi:hypothetical protein